MHMAHYIGACVICKHHAHSTRQSARPSRGGISTANAPPSHPPASEGSAPVPGWNSAAAKPLPNSTGPLRPPPITSLAAIPRKAPVRFHSRPFPLAESETKNHIGLMITSLRESKTRLSELVQLASGGEEILITVRGKPKARLTALGASPEQSAGWMAELGKLRRSLGRRPPRRSTALDEVREDRS